MARQSIRYLRMVWAAITAQPEASARQIAATLATGYSYGDVSSALRQLVAAGYISDPPARGAPRTIYLPFSASLDDLRQAPSYPRTIPPPPPPPRAAAAHIARLGLTAEARQTIDTARRPGESDAQVINRILESVLAFAADV